MAREENPSPYFNEIRDAYELHDLIPTNFEKKRYGLIDTVTLGLAKSALSQAKNTWHRVTKSEAGAAESFALLVRQLINASNKLNSTPLADLLKAVDAAAAKLPQAANSKDIGLEIATDLLFIENTLDHLNRTSEDFPQRVDALVGRLNLAMAGEPLPETTQWLDDLTQQSHQKQTVGVLASEMETGLRQVEKMLGRFLQCTIQSRSLGRDRPDPASDRGRAVHPRPGRRHAGRAADQVRHPELQGFGRCGWRRCARPRVSAFDHAKHHRPGFLCRSAAATSGIGQNALHFRS